MTVIRIRKVFWYRPRGATTKSKSPKSWKLKLVTSESFFTLGLIRGFVDEQLRVFFLQVKSFIQISELTDKVMSH